MPPSIVRCEIQPGELRCVGARFRMGRAVGITLSGLPGHGDHGPSVSRFSNSRYSGSPSASPAASVVVDHDRDVIRIVERRGAALERRVVEFHFGDASAR